MKAHGLTSNRAPWVALRAGVPFLLLSCLLACGGQMFALADGSSSTDANLDVAELTATAPSVDAPDYTLDVAGLFILTDANNIIQSATGTATLTAGSVAGQRYVVLDVAGLTTYAELDDAYVTGDDAELLASIPAVGFTLIGGDLTTSQLRTLLIANVVSGVRSYQAFEVTFHQAL